MNRIQKVNDNDSSLYCVSNVFITSTCHKLSSIIPTFLYCCTSNSYSSIIVYKDQDIILIRLINRIIRKCIWYSLFCIEQ